MRTPFLVPLALLLASPGCFKEPKPKCEFLCGTAGECPGGYACDPSDHRCHLLENGAPAMCEDTLPADAAASPDGPDVDAPPPPDGVPDGAVDSALPPDAPPDAPAIDAEIADAPPD